MIRLRSPVAARRLPWARLAAALVIPLGCDGDSPDEGGVDGPAEDGPAEDGGPDGAPATADATGAARLVGVTRYVREGPDDPFEVSLEGPAGTSAGRLTFGGDGNGGYSATLTADDVEVSELGASQGEGGAVRRRVLTAGGVSLTIEDLHDAQGAWLETVWIVPLPTAEVPEALGWRPAAAGGEGFIVVASAGGGRSSAAEIEALYAAGGLADLFAEPSVARLIGAMADPALMTLLGLAGRPAQSGDGSSIETLESAIHDSPRCASLRTRLQSSEHPACAECAQLDPDPRRYIPEGLRHGGRLGLLYMADCAECGRAMAGLRQDLVDCTEAFQAIAASEEQCHAREGRFGTSYQWIAFGHGICEERCDPPKCDKDCGARSDRYEIEGDCRERWVCECDYSKACREAYGDRLCQTLSRGCLSVSCGDGWHTAVGVCPENPALGEVCDPLATHTGCPAGKRCSADCGSCEQECQCTSDADCDGGRCGFNCTCVDTPTSCADDLIDFFLAAGKWCDPEAGAAWCGPGRRCDAPTCRCEDDEAPDPVEPAPGDCEHPRAQDGVVQGGEVVERPEQFASYAGCTTVEGNLWISPNPEIVDLAGFEALERVTGYLQVTDGEGLTDISALAKLREVGGNAIFRGNPLLAEVSLPKLASVGGVLQVSAGRRGDRGLLATVSFPVLASVGGDLSPGGLPAGASLELPQLHSVGGGVTIAADGLIELPKLKTIGGNVALSSASGALRGISFPALESIGGEMRTPTVRVDHSPLTTLELGALASIDGRLIINLATGLSSLQLTSLTTCGGLSVTTCTTLESIAAPALRRVEGNLVVANNAELTSLELGALQEVVDDLKIADNPKLPEEVAQELADRVDVGGATEIYDNGP